MRLSYPPYLVSFKICWYNAYIYIFYWGKTDLVKCHHHISKGMINIIDKWWVFSTPGGCEKWRKIFIENYIIPPSDRALIEQFHWISLVFTSAWAGLGSGQWAHQTLVKIFNWIIVRVEGQWSSEGGATFGFSFGLVVLAALIYLLDIGIVYMATREPDRTRKVSEVWRFRSFLLSPGYFRPSCCTASLASRLETQCSTEEKLPRLNRQ